MSNPLLSVSNYGVSIGGKPLVEAINFEIHAGETYGLVGESGSGKSASCLGILRLLKAEYRGSVDLFGVGNLLAMKAQDMPRIRGKEIAMVFQEPMTSLNPVYTCGYQVAEALEAHSRYSKKEVRELVLNGFSEVRLPDPRRIWSAYPHELSGGQKQRVMIAMALINSPKLLIADEPTTALDVTVQQKLIDLLVELQAQRGMAMIFISHDLGLMAKIASRVGVMYKGSLIEEAPVEVLFNSPKTPYTKGLIRCRPPKTGHPKRLPTVSDFMEGKENQLDFHTERAVLESKEVLVEARDLHLSYPLKRNLWGKVIERKTILDAVGLTLMKGETHGLVGESGCGKSTLGRVLLRLQTPEKGSVRIHGTSLYDLSPRELRQFRPKIQMIFQDPYASLNPRMCIGEAIAEPISFHKKAANRKEAKEKAILLLEQVGLTADHYFRYPHQFSGGQRQRIGIARALAVEPDFIVCDESVSALDVSVQAVILNLLQSLKEKYNLTYLFISHDLSVQRYFCDRISVMQEGKIIETGVADEVFFNPTEPYTQNLIRAIPS
jgi:peptide/nickel transport system ATP-binding protein